MKKKTKTITFNTACAQGDIHVTRITGIPVTAVPVNPVDGKIIITHSETGHHHVMDAAGAKLFNDYVNPLAAFLLVETPTALLHLRPHDTHAPIMFKAGVYEVRRQREYTPEGFRRVED